MGEERREDAARHPSQSLAKSKKLEDRVPIPRVPCGPEHSLDRRSRELRRANPGGINDVELFPVAVNDLRSFDGGSQCLHVFRQGGGLQEHDNEVARITLRLPLRMDCRRRLSSIHPRFEPRNRRSRKDVRLSPSPASIPARLRTIDCSRRQDCHSAHDLTPASPRPSQRPRR